MTSTLKLPEHYYSNYQESSLAWISAVQTMLNTYNEYNVIQPRELKNAAIGVLLTLDVMLMERSSTQNLISAKKTISITLQKCKLTPG